MYKQMKRTVNNLEIIFGNPFHTRLVSYYVYQIA